MDRCHGHKAMPGKTNCLERIPEAFDSSTSFDLVLQAFEESISYNNTYIYKYKSTPINLVEYIYMHSYKKKYITITLCILY